MFNADKSFQFNTMLYKDQTPHNQKDLDVSSICLWLMENLRPREVIAGVAVTQDGLIGIPARTNSFNVKRFTNFIHGVIETYDRIYEFLPGQVLVHRRPPARLRPQLQFDSQTLPHPLAVFYPGAIGCCERYMQFVDVGWLETSPHTDIHSVRLEHAPAINGGLIRNAFSRYSRLQKNTPGRKLGGKELWINLLGEVAATDSEFRFLNEYRDELRAFDPSAAELFQCWKTVKAMESLNLSPPELAAQFREAVHSALRSLLQQRKSQTPA